MAKKKHIKDKKLHNFDEKLHNSNEPDLTWQESVDLLPEVEGGSEIYYFTDDSAFVPCRLRAAHRSYIEAIKAQKTA
jgi:hypothetical protein